MSRSFSNIIKINPSI